MSVPVQLIAWKVLSPKWPVICQVGRQRLHCQLFQIVTVWRIQCRTGITHQFRFLTFGHSGAQDWAPECPHVRNRNWWVRPVWQSVKR